MNETTDTSPPPAPPHTARPPLRRSITDRKVAGVAGGLGRYFNVDPLIFRVVFVTLAIFGGSGLLLYAVGWLLVPEEGDNESEVSRLVNGRATTKIIGGVLLGVVGLIAVGNFARTSFGFGGFAALVAIAIAIYLFSRSDDRPLVAPRQAPAQTPPVFSPPNAPGAYGQTPGTAYATAAPAAAPTQPIAHPPAVAPPTAGPRSPLGKVTLSLALVAAGVLVAWDLATTHDVPAEVVLAVCLAVVGLGLVVGGFAGRARRLIFVGALLVVATTAAGVSHVGLRGGIGDRSWAPRSVAAVHDTYRLGIGQARLDLSQVQFAPGETVNVAFRQGIGDLLIVLPAQVPVDVDTDVNAGSIRLPRGPEQNGTSVHRRYVDPRDAAAVITIDAELGVGSLEVRRATP
jgi:phage shock protein PspC (stress-responsive transcriptional regulator)/predicted membrane protein